ncbi:MAG: UUP1 family membrane protein [Betaproteobacteria bacterium]|nr:UUP1 family membrane protein [Betaproteobacteria bacterium]MBI2960348.1 UUP1 family membrane protein [Betaproteobacteria bacterium]
MSRRHLYLLCAFLAICGLTFFLYKALVLKFPLQPEKQIATWRVEVRMQFEARGEPVKLKMNLPHSGNNLVIIDQNFVSAGYGLTTGIDRGNQVAVFAIRAASGPQTVYYRVLIHALRSADDLSREPVPDLPSTRLEGAERLAAERMMASARMQSADPETLAALLLKRLKSPAPSAEAALLLGPQPTSARVINVAVDLLRLGGIPARPVHGLTLEPERRGAHFITWLELHNGRNWVPRFPSEARPVVPEKTLRWWQGRTPLAEVVGGEELSHSVAVSRSYEYALATAIKQGQKLEQKLVEFSLFGLPIQTQSVYRSVLVIPIGILLLVILRNVVGLKTFGTFMPVLIAISFRQTELLWGAIFFAVIVAVGLSIRFYMEQLKLLLVPRLAAVVIVVVLTLAALTIFSHKLGFERGLSIGLFPIIILTMTIERMSIVWEERGPLESLQQALGSLAVGALCYLLMSLAIVEHLTFVFPELLLLVLAAILLLGRYSGYRLTELRRFRELAR